MLPCPPPQGKTDRYADSSIPYAIWLLNAADSGTSTQACHWNLWTIMCICYLFMCLSVISSSTPLLGTKHGNLCVHCFALVLMLTWSASDGINCKKCLKWNGHMEVVKSESELTMTKFTCTPYSCIGIFRLRTSHVNTCKTWLRSYSD